MKNISEMKQLNHFLAEIDAVYHEAALKFGLSDSTMLILYMFCENGNEYLLSDLPNMAGISKQTVNSAVRKLEKSGDVFLTKAEGRRKKICLTEKGKKTVKETVFKLAETENNILDSWTEEDRLRYLFLTRKFLYALKEGVKNL